MRNINRKFCGLLTASGAEINVSKPQERAKYHQNYTISRLESNKHIYRCLSSLRTREYDDADIPRICSDEDYQTAMAISEVLQQQMLRVIKELPSSTLRVATGHAKEPLLLKAFWDALPEAFEARDFKAIAQEVGLSIPTAERYIRRWADTRLEKVYRGLYRKR